MLDSRELVRTIVEECWSDPAGLERMREHLAEGYVHHTVMGDWTFEQYGRGLEWVDSNIADRTYRVEHILIDGDLAAAYIAWTGTRRADGSHVEGRGAYHCRLEDGRIAEDWDVFYPLQ
jgi:ketosteroid isomerase-like protein